MPLEGDLRKIKKTQDDQASLKKKKAEEERTREKQREKELIKEAQKLSSGKIEPLLQAVNKVYANGKGFISRPGYDKYHRVLLETTLIWNDHSDSRRDYEDYDYIRARINLDDRTVEFNGYRLVIDDPEFNSKAEAVIKTILEIPGRFHYRDANYL